MIKYSASYARMRGLKGKLIGREQLEALLQLSDFRSVLSSLKNTFYGEQIRDLMDIHLVEHALKQDLILSYTKILTFLRGKPAILLKTFLGRFELYNIKTIIRSLIYGETSKEKIDPFIFSLGKYHTIPIDEALESKNMEDFINVVRNTPYARPLEIGYQQYESEKTLFPLEIALDIDYYVRLKQALDNLGPIDRLDSWELLSLYYDIINLIWMFRFREYFKYTPEQIFQYIIPYGQNIKGEIFWKIVGENDLVKAIYDIRLKPYDHLLRSANQIDGNYILGIEIGLFRYLYNQSIKVMMKFPLQSAPFIAFFILKEMEIKDIITILTCKNLGTSQEKVRDYLITL
ncbi:MAG: V-type ATPase subunit [bacterium]